MLISILDIALINRQRKHLDHKKVQELANSIAANGLLHPIVVRAPFESELDAAGQRPYVLAVGGRRLAAHIVLGRTEIEASLKEDLDPISARIVELDENLQRENITWQEETDARAEIAALTKQLNPSAVFSEIAAAVGVSEAQLSKDLSLHRAIQADPSLKIAVSKGSAIRTAAFKADMKKRIENVDTTLVDELRSRLHTCDARMFLSALPDNSVDLVFTDLPYGFDYFEVTKAPGSLQSTYDDSIEATRTFLRDVVPAALRVVKPTGWVVFFMGYELHGFLQDLLRTVCSVHGGNAQAKSVDCTNNSVGDPCKFLSPEMPPWIWTRRGQGNHGHWPELHASNRYEILVVVNGGSARLTKKPVENVLDFPPFSGDRLHAMQKPHELCQEIISRTTLPGETVLDFCFGSGAHLAAAKSLGRQILGCDANPENLNSALALVSQHTKDNRLKLSLV